jgi:hypothetical protein
MPSVPEAGWLQAGMSALRDVFIHSLCGFTHLHSPSTMRRKNALALRVLLRAAHPDNMGNYLEDRLEQGCVYMHAVAGVCGMNVAQCQKCVCFRSTADSFHPSVQLRCVGPLPFHG